MFNSSRDLIPSSDSLDYANRWRSPHTEPACNGDRKLCSTRREISSPETPDAPLLPKALRRRFGVEKPSFRNLKLRFYPTISPIPRFSGSRDSLDYANRLRSPHREPACHGDRKLCSTHREISSPAKELGITFRPGIGIAYVTTIRNRHFETVDRALVSRNSVMEPKFHPGVVDMAAQTSPI
ncbi:hypothetical protein Taro_013936 [Colocasia esculenta]|uniref:Uncharacterized protein n=1 Tax=Colocasia esculenta TaxID=4460 RepID=A0A843UHH0_COLES|nr:hypothetical protein [Colocasia esculenta]